MSQEQLTTEELEQLSRDTHFLLREQLLKLRDATLDQSQRQLLDNQVAMNMRSLFAYHKALYEREQGKALVTENLRQMGAFLNWREDKLGVFGDDSYLDSEANDSYILFKTDRKRFRQLFQPLYSINDYTNHWHIKITGDEEMNLGDIHTDLTYGRVMSYFIPGRGTRFYHGGIIPDQSQPTITINETGHIDMSKLT